MAFSDSFIEEVRSRNDILDIVGQVVHLERRGANHFGLCPFHNEKTPSFSVHQGKQIFHCFGCNAGGNVISFVMQYENLTFTEAIRNLAERAGMAVPDEDNSENARRVRDKKQRLLAVNKEAALFYYHQLYEDAGKQGRQYFADRGLDDRTIKHFGLGYADVGGNPLVKHLRKEGFTDAEIIEAGLATHDEKRGITEKFWNRVMFPIFDGGNHVIGFGGRVLGDGKPKYLNSPETLIFDKGRNLYGLNYARGSRTGSMILCEGYMDVIAMHQAGFTQAVASLGTAFTEMQARILGRYADEVILSYDSDEAGIMAAKRAIGILKEAGLRGRVLNLAPHKDPDEFIKNEGRDAFAERLKKAESTYFFELRVAERDYDMQDPEGRTRFIRAAAEKLCGFSEPIERENYIAATASKYGISLEDLRHLVADMAARTGIAQPAVRARRQNAAGDAGRREEDERRLKPQRMLLTWLSDEPGLLPVIEQYLKIEDFSDPLYRQIAERMFADIRAGTLVPAAIISGCAEEDQARVAALFDTPVQGVNTVPERERALENLIRDIRRHALEDEAAAFSKEDPAYLSLVVENRKKIDELKKLKISLS